MFISEEKRADMFISEEKTCWYRQLFWLKCCKKNGLTKRKTYKLQKV